MNHPGCPSATVLHAFHTGELNTQQLELVGDHIAACPHCERVMENFDRQADPLLDALKRRPELDCSRNREAPPTSTVITTTSESSEATSSDLPEIPGYAILERIGQGGMSNVYKAIQSRLKRYVALKQLRVRDSRLFSRAVKEAELLARLHHPRIVQIYEVFEHAGQVYLALEWIEGGSLANRLDGKPLPIAECSHIVEELARAIHYAHQQGIIHRDIKPANILLASESLETKISDFGIARSVDQSSTETLQGDVLGTPNYMSPEQARGDVSQIGVATDIYSLGVVLYEMLTGRVPLQGPTTADTLELVRTQEPVSPRRLQPLIPVDLETICLKCLEKATHRRYSTAEELGEDLRRFSSDLPISARRPSPLDQWRRFHRRQRTLVNSLIAVFASLCLGFGWTLVYAIRESTQRQMADFNANTARLERQSALREAYRGRVAAATAALLANDVNEARRQLEAAPRDLRNWEWNYLHAQLDESLQIWRPNSQEGQPLVVEDSNEPNIAYVDSKQFSVYDLHHELQWTQSIPENADEWFLFWGNQKRFLYNTAESSLLKNGSGATIFSWPRIYAADHHPSSNQIAVSYGNSEQRCKLTILPIDSPTSKLECLGHTDVIHCIRYSPDGSKIATASEDGTARVWDSTTGREISICRGHLVKVYHVSFRLDGSRLLTASADGTVRQWDPSTGEPIEANYEGHDGEVLTATYSPDGSRIVSGGADKTIRLWTAVGRKDVDVWHGHTGQVEKLTFDRSGSKLFSQSSDRTVRLWNVDPDHSSSVLRGHSSYVYPVRFSPDGTRLASGSWDNTIRIWNLETGRLEGTLPHPSRIQDMDFSPDGSRLISGCGEDDQLRLWDTKSLKLIRSYKGPGVSTYGVAFHPEGNRIAAVTQHDQAAILDSDSGAVIDSFSSGSYSSQIAFSRDGHWLALGGRDGDLYLRSHLHRGKFFTAKGHTAGLSAVAFLPDGHRLITSSNDHTLRLWEIFENRPPNCIGVLKGHSDAIFAVAVHPRGDRIASAGRDGVIRLWETDSLQEVARLQGHRNYVWSLDFSPSGETLASGSGDSTVRIWDTRSLQDRWTSGTE